MKSCPGAWCELLFDLKPYSVDSEYACCIEVQYTHITRVHSYSKFDYLVCKLVHDKQCMTSWC